MLLLNMWYFLGLLNYWCFSRNCVISTLLLDMCSVNISLGLMDYWCFFRSCGLLMLHLGIWTTDVSLGLMDYWCFPRIVNQWGFSCICRSSTYGLLMFLQLWTIDASLRVANRWCFSFNYWLLILPLNYELLIFLFELWAINIFLKFWIIDASS